MSLDSKLRDAEQHGAMESVRTGIHNLEAALHKLVSRRRGKPALADAEREREKTASPKVRTGIVSVNGRDVGELRCTGGRRTM